MYSPELQYVHEDSRGQHAKYDRPGMVQLDNAGMNRDLGEDNADGEDLVEAVRVQRVYFENGDQGEEDYAAQREF